MTNELRETAKLLRANGYNPTLVDARFIKPLDKECYRSLFESHKVIVTLEDNTLVGGYGSAVAELLVDFGFTDKKLLRFGLPDKFVEQGDIKALFKMLEIDGASVAKRIMEKL